jgi:hypothetical protein
MWFACVMLWRSPYRYNDLMAYLSLFILFQNKLGTVVKVEGDEIVSPKFVGKVKLERDGKRF